jgi:hypothetical protein
MRADNEEARTAFYKLGKRVAKIVVHALSPGGVTD